MRKENEDEVSSVGDPLSKGAKCWIESDSEESSSNNADMETSNEMIADTPVKRKRGRPKKGETVIKQPKYVKKGRTLKVPKMKATKKQRKDAEDDAHSHQEEDKDDDEWIEGDPLSKDAENSSNESENNSNDKETTTQNVDQLRNLTEGAEPIKRKLGRPKKGEIRIKKPKYVIKEKKPKEPKQPKKKPHRLLNEDEEYNDTDFVEIDDDNDDKHQAKRPRTVGGKCDQTRFARYLELWSQHPHYKIINPADIQLDNVTVFRNLMQSNFVYESLSLSDWMSNHGFDQMQTQLLPINIKIAESNKQLRIPAYDGDNVDHDLYINSSCPISSIAGIAFNDMNFLAIGGTRIGWPSNDTQLDYEVINSYEERNLTTITQQTGFATDFLRGVAELEVHDNLLQIWSVDIPAKLEYFVALPKRGSTIKVLRAAVDLTAVNSLGLIMILNGNGQVDVLLLPHPKLLPTATGEEPIVLPVESLLLCQLHFNDVMITAIAWNPNDPFELCCGQSDGSCSLWSIKQACLHGTTQPQLLMRLQDCSTDHRTTANKAVLTVAVSAHFPQYIASGGLFGSLKIWSRNEPSIPLAVKAATTGIAAIQWDVTGAGLFWTELENTILHWEPLWSQKEIDLQRRKRTTPLFHRCKYGAIWDFRVIPYNNEESLMISAASDGTVRAGLAAERIYEKSDKTGMVELFNLHTVTTSEDGTEGVVTIKTKIIESSKTAMNVDNRLHQNAKKALYAMDVIRNSDNKQLLAYGGAAGFVHVHTFSL